MGIKKNSLITLDNQANYLVVETANFNDKQYLYLVNKNDYNDVKIGFLTYENNVMKVVIVEGEEYVAAAVAFYDLVKEDINI